MPPQIGVGPKNGRDTFATLQKSIGFYEDFAKLHTFACETVFLTSDHQRILIEKVDISHEDRMRCWLHQALRSRTVVSRNQREP